MPASLETIHQRFKGYSLSALAGSDESVRQDDLLAA